ncbi:MAG: histidinol-phosphatase [Acidimicrobiales bacterium]
MLDYHVHLWPHPEKADPLELRLERLTVYCENARSEGVTEIALTEHFFRFRQGHDCVGDFWKDDPNPSFVSTMAAYFAHHATADLDAYVEAALAAKRAGLPVIIGLEVDYYAGQMDAVGAMLSGYPFDVLLGSVHWLGNWNFDLTRDAVSMAEWERRDVADVWRAYTEALAELAATRSCDVLAHPDFVKMAGYRPSPAAIDECHDRIAEAAASSGMAAEISSGGWRCPGNEEFPAPGLLNRFFRRGVPVTTASDSHGPENVASRSSELRKIALGAGYTTLRAFRERRGLDHPIDDAKLARSTPE